MAIKHYPKEMKNLFNKLADEAKQNKLVQKKKKQSAQNIIDWALGE